MKEGIMGRQAPQSPIFSAWSRIVFDRRGADRTLSPEAEREWTGLWDQHIAGNALAETVLEDAVLLCTLGWEIAMQRQDFQEALLRARRCFQHPHWDQADDADHEWLLSCVAQAQWHLGDEIGALAECRRILQRKRPCHHVPLHHARLLLRGWCLTKSPDEIAPADFTAMAAEVTSQFSGCVRLARTMNPGTSTFGDIAAVLQQTS
ncbi:MAG: hypothetical protein ACK47B_27930 [Armatimonadota bacterium]